MTTAQTALCAVGLTLLLVALPSVRCPRASSGTGSRSSILYVARACRGWSHKGPEWLAICGQDDRRPCLHVGDHSMSFCKGCGCERREPQLKAPHIPRTFRVHAGGRADCHERGKRLTALLARLFSFPLLLRTQ